VLQSRARHQPKLSKLLDSTAQNGLAACKVPIIFEISPAAVVQALRPEHAPAPLTLTIAGRYQLDIRDDFRAQALEKVVRTPERL